MKIQMKSSLQSLKKKTIQALMQYGTGRKLLRAYYQSVKKEAVSLVELKSVRQHIFDSGGVFYGIDKRQEKNCLVYRNQKDEREYRKIFFPESYVGIINDAYVLSASENVFVDGACLCDRVDDVKDRDWIFPTDNTWLMLGWSAKDKKALVRNPVEDLHYDKAVNLVYRFPWGYWHVVYETLSRFYYVEMFPEYESWPVLIDEQVFGDQTLARLFTFLNIHNHPVIKVKRRQVIHLGKMFYPSQQMTEQIGNFLPKRFHEAARWWVISRNEAIKWMRKQVLSKIYTKMPSKKVFVMRGKNDRLMNENEVADYLEKQGFDCITMDGRSFEEEVRIFAEAKIMICIHGGAMTNVLWCSPGTKVFQILPDSLMSQNASYFNMGECVGFDSYTIPPVVVEDNPLAPLAKYRMDLKVLEKALQEIQ